MRVYRCELLERDAYVLFMGSDLAARFGVDLTGGTLFRREPGVRPVTVAALHQMIRHRCGIFGERRFGEQRDAYISHNLLLPLHATAPSLPQFIGYSADAHKTYRQAEGNIYITRAEWVDIGFGVPRDQLLPVGKVSIEDDVVPDEKRPPA
jgi:hypothetical protein